MQSIRRLRDNGWLARFGSELEIANSRIDSLERLAMPPGSPERLKVELDDVVVDGRATERDLRLSARRRTIFPKTFTSPVLELRGSRETTSFMFYSSKMQP
jgi:hypothetical protein